MKKILPVLLLSSLILTGCKGGSGSSSSDAAAPESPVTTASETTVSEEKASETTVSEEKAAKSSGSGESGEAARLPMQRQQAGPKQLPPELSRSRHPQKCSP